MALPSKLQQIAAVAKFLDSDKTEGESLEDVAKAIVEGFHEALLKDLKKPAQPLRLGMLFKHVDGKVRRVVWTDGVQVWLVTDNASYGWLGRLSDESWQYAEEYRPKRRAEVDGKVKLVEMSDEDIGEAWSNPHWKVGDRFSQHQREFVYEVIAVAPTCVLMVSLNTGNLISDSNANLEKHYRLEAQW